MNDLVMELTIENEGILYQPIIEEGITLEWTRKNAPGKLSFKLINDKNINFQEGNAVRFIINNINMFYGFVFTKKRDKEQIITVTCYDSLRYFKNKDSVKYTCSASELIKMISEDYLLKCGDIEDTKITVSYRADNQTLFDIVNEAFMQTLEKGGTTYILYDDFGRITLKSMENMRLDYLVCGYNAENFTYESSIDGDTFNYIRLVYEDESGERKNYDVQDGDNIKKWGILQYCDEAKSIDTCQLKAKELLRLYNIKRRKFNISGVLGDLRVRAGCLLPVKLVLGDIDANTYLLVEDVKHIFKNNNHTMDLTLRGGDFV